MIALRFFACGSFQVVVGDLFGVSKSTVHLCIKRVSDIIAASLQRHVFFDLDDVQATKQKFYSMAGMPDVIGCIDCTHIRIQRPHVNEHEYVNRKRYHSLNVQLICNSDMLIINCVTNYPGSVHDSRILRRSSIFQSFESNPPLIDGWLLGDSGYMLKPWLLTPYLNPRADTPQYRYNEAHTSTRCTIERCNGVLKRRWSCLHSELKYQPERAVQTIKACIVLQNFAVRNKVPLPDHYEIEDNIVAWNHNAEMPDITGRLVRDRVANQFFD